MRTERNHSLCRLCPCPFPRHLTISSSIPTNWSIHVSSIYVRTKSHLRWCCDVVLPEVTWPEVTSVTWQEVTSVTWLEVTSITCHVRKYVLRMRNRLRNIYPSGAFWPEVTKSPDLKRPCPEAVLMGSRFCACPAFSRVFFLSSSTVVTWLPKVTWPLRGSLGCAHAQPEVVQHP